MCLLKDYDNLCFRAPLWKRPQGWKKLGKREGHPGLVQYEPTINQWTLTLKGLGLVQSFGRAHPTLRKIREHENEPKKTTRQITKTTSPSTRYRQKRMSRLKTLSHNLFTFVKNLGPDQKTDRHQIAKGKKYNRLKQRVHYSVSHIIKLLKTKNLGEKKKTKTHQNAKEKNYNKPKQKGHFSSSHIIKLLMTKNLGEKQKPYRHHVANRITKLLRAKNLREKQKTIKHQVASRIIKLLKKNSRKYVRFA